MNKVFENLSRSLNQKVLIMSIPLFFIGLAFLVPKLAIGANEIELKVKPLSEEVLLSWKTNGFKADSYRIKKSIADETYEIEISGGSNSFVDQEVLPRQNYSYKIFAYKKGKQIAQSNDIAGVILATADNPHGMYSNATDLCSKCHYAKTDKDGKTLEVTQTDVCFNCHNNIKNTYMSAKEGSTHSVLGDTVVLKCSSCHRPHLQSDDNNPKILGVLFSKNAKTIKFNANSGDDFCFSCHSGQGGSGLVIDKKTYVNSLHGNSLVMQPSSGSKISCNSCHTPHASKFGNLLKSKYDLKASSSSYDNYQLCFSCHDDEGTTNILNYYNGSKDGVNKGHYIKDKDLAEALNVSIGWKLACNDCHSPHGSKNSKMLSNSFDELTKIDDTISRERAICANCHQYSDTGAKSSFRGVSFAKLPSTVEQHKVKPDGDIKSCSTCHGNNNLVAGVHAPKSELTSPLSKIKGDDVKEDIAKPNEATTGTEDITLPRRDIETTGEDSVPGDNSIPEQVTDQNSPDDETGNTDFRNYK